MQTAAFLPGGTPGGGELLVVCLAILILFGSKRLPELARSLGRALEEFRRAAREVSDEIHKAADQSPPPDNAAGQAVKDKADERGG